MSVEFNCANKNLEQLHTHSYSFLCRFCLGFCLTEWEVTIFSSSLRSIQRCWIVVGKATKMVDGHRDMEGWGVYSIFKEAGRLLYRHIRILRPFILAFLLPLALILFLEVIGTAWLLTWVADHVQPHHLGGIFGHHRHSGFHAFHAAFFKAPNPPNPISVFVLELLLVTYTLLFLLFTISWLLVSLATAAIAKAVHHIYSSSNTDSNSSQTQTQTQTVTQSIFTSLPHSLYRIFVLSLCFFVVDTFTYFLLALPFFLLSESKFDPASHLPLLHTWLWNLVYLILNFWFLVSVQVAALESHYDGWAALQRSAKLVKAKAATALGLLVVYFVYICLVNWITRVAVTIPAHSVVVYVVAGALAVGCLAVAAFWLVVVSVFYFVSKCKCSGGADEEGRQVQGDRYQALDVSIEN